MLFNFVVVVATAVVIIIVTAGETVVVFVIIPVLLFVPFLLCCESVFPFVFCLIIYVPTPCSCRLLQF